MLVDEIKVKVSAAMKAQDTVARDILRLALGEIQTAEARRNGPLTDEEATQAVRKLIKSNEETLGLTTDAERAAVLRRETEVLTALLPAQLSPEKIVELLGPVHEAIKASKSDGQATGVAMKHLKTAGASVNGADVGVAVKTIRGQ